MKRGLFIGFLFFRFGFSGVCWSPPDTTVIAESIKGVRIDKEHSSVIWPIQIDFQNLDKSNALYISFEGIFLEKSPEGVYEVYLADSVPAIRCLNAASPFFVHGINTYYLAGRGPGRQMMNASRQLAAIRSQKNKNGKYYLVIVFRGNSFPDHSLSNEAGILLIKAIRLVGT